MNKGCVHCVYCTKTDEINLYVCKLIEHNVVGNTQICSDFEAMEDTENDTI